MSPGAIRNSSVQKQTDPDDYELREEYDLSTMTVVPRDMHLVAERARTWSC